MQPSTTAIVQTSVSLFLSLYLVSLPLSLSLAFVVLVTSMFIDSGSVSWQLIAIGFILLYHARKGYEAFNSAAAITSSSNQLSSLSMLLGSMRSSISPIDPKTSVKH